MRHIKRITRETAFVLKTIQPFHFRKAQSNKSRKYPFLTFFMICILSTTACGGGGGGDAPEATPVPVTATAPLISSFTATPTVISAGTSSELAWSVQNAESIRLNDDHVNGNIVSVTPSVTTVYTLTATNTAGSRTASVTVTVGTSATVYGNLVSADLGIGANLNGAVPFPIDNDWNTDITTAPIDPSSDAIIANIGLNTGLHPDFGAGLYEGAPIGIPYIVVSASQPDVDINFVAYGDESDPGPYPVPANAPIEGQQADGSEFDGDRHVLVIDRDANRLYELGYAFPLGDGSWQANCGAAFDLASNDVRPGGQPGWTSADAAGLPIFPGLARYEEAANGMIRHALRFTVQVSRRAYIPPATHWASSNTSADRPPMGMRVRLKAGYIIPDSFSTESKAILQALKTYGMIVADNGSNWFISGAPDDRWPNDRLVSELGSVKGSNFEVIRMDGLVTP